MRSTNTSVRSVYNPPSEPVPQQRCGWCGTDSLYCAYHDREWGVPLHDERRLFEFMLLEGAQAGLSWRLILHRRERYRLAFDGFDPVRIADYGAPEIARLLADPGIVRNRRKIDAAIANARATLALYARDHTLAGTLWQFVNGVPRQNHWRHLSEVPARTPESAAMSRELRRLGFRFVGPTICYALMQAVGLVNDHLVDCFRHAELSQAA